MIEQMLVRIDCPLGAESAPVTACQALVRLGYSTGG